MTCHNSYAQRSMISLYGAHGRAPRAGVPAEIPQPGSRARWGRYFAGPRTLRDGFKIRDLVRNRGTILRS